jgi:drug/metabolite transporter (DMT)-like permease
MIRPSAERMDQSDYRLGILYAIATAVLLAIQEPFSALAARTLSSLDFMAVTQLALLSSLPFLISRSDARQDFAAILLDIRQWPRLAVIFLVGVAGLSLYDVGLSSAHPIITAAVLNLSPFIFLVGVAGLSLYDVGLSSAHPIITAAVLNLSPFWAALVSLAISRRSVAVSPVAFWICFVAAFCGAMVIAWSQVDVDNRTLARDLISSLLHSKWIYALPMPAFFALSGTLVFEWFSDYDEAATIGANFVVSALVLLPAAAINSGQASLHLSEQSATAIVLLLAGTLAASAAGRVFYQLALTSTKNDNGTVTMFFLLIPAISALISWPLSRWIPTLSFIPGPTYLVGMALVCLPLIAVTLISRRRWSSSGSTPSVAAVNPAE